MSDCENSGQVHLKETFGENGVPIRESSLSTETPTNPQRLGRAVVSRHAGWLQSSDPGKSSTISGFNRRLVGSSAQRGGNLNTESAAKAAFLLAALPREETRVFDV